MQKKINQFYYNKTIVIFWKAFVIICNIHKLVILFYLMYFNRVMQWKHIIINYPNIIVALFYIMHFKAVVGLGLF